jgi:hypothetical protein
VNAVGTSSTSSTATVTPSAPTIPGAPTGLTPVGLDSSVGLSWTAPASDGGADITDYIVEYKLSTSGSWSVFSDGTSTSTTATVTGLTNGLLYNFRVKTVNSIGTSSASATANGTPVTIDILLSDSFTGTTIDTNKWIESDPGGLGGTTGNIQQNGTLSAAVSDSGGEGTYSLDSVDSFTADRLELSATIVPGGLPLFGYGDRVWTGISNKAYIIYIDGNNLMGLSWYNGSLIGASNLSCGATTSGATYKMIVISTGFEVYKNDVLQCTVTPPSYALVDNKPVFLQSNASTPSTFDNVQVIGTQTPDTVPDAPTSVVAAAGNTNALISFSTPSNGGSPITEYTVTSSPGDHTATGSSSPITVTGLTNGTDYTFTVTATNDVGTSNPSSASNSITPHAIAAPEQVTGLVANGANQQVRLGWTAPTSDASITDYIVQYKLSSGSSWLTFADGTSSATKAIITGLRNGTSYDFKVSAVSGGGTGTASSSQSATPNPITTLAVVFTGESNSGGQAANTNATSEELAPTAEVPIINTNSLLFEPLDVGTNNNMGHSGLSSSTTHGFEIGLANAVKANTFPDNPLVYLIKTGQGGSTVAQWAEGQANWTQYLQRTGAAKTQMPTENRQWVVWLSLGINDYIAGTTVNNFKTGLLAHINKIKVDLPGTIVILTQFQAMSSNSGYPTYNQAMAEIAATEPNVFVVDSTGTTLDDGNHWSYSGYKVMANRMITITNTQLGLLYPGVPTNLNVTPSGTHANLTWTAPVSNGGSSITDYKIEYKLHSGSTWTIFNDGTSTTAAANVTGLSGSSEYDFRVSAVNSNGAGNSISSTGTTTDGEAPVISNLVVEATDSSAVVTWDTNEAASTFVDYGITDSYEVSTSETNTSPRVTSHSVSINGLVACATYFFRVNSTDANSNTGDSGDNSVFSTSGCTGSAGRMSGSSTSIDYTTGGTAELDNEDNTGLHLTIPDDALNADATFIMSGLVTAEIVDEIGIPDGFRAVSGYTYELKALLDVSTSQESFDAPITLTLHYNSSDISHIQESSLVIYHYKDDEWTPLPCEVNASTNTITCTTDSFSLFALMGEASSSGTSGSAGVTSHAIGTNIVTTDGTIFTLTADGNRRPYTSAGAFLSYGFNSFANTVPANSADLSKPVGSFIPPRDGSITCSDRGTDMGTCYLITAGKRAGFTSSSVFNALGFSFLNAQYGDVSFMETAPNISTAQQAHLYGTLINNSGTLQIIASGALVGIPSMQVLTSWGYNPAHAVIANSFDRAYQQMMVLGERLAGVLSF